MFNINTINKRNEIKSQKGMTLLEIIIVLGIVGTIAAGVVILAQRAFDSRAISSIVTNSNSIRLAAKALYSGKDYPVSTGKVFNSEKDLQDSDEPIAILVKASNLSVAEATNGISNDIVNFGAAQLNGKPRGFFVEYNGLNQDQCRSIINQIGNSWDYVAVGSGAGVGSYSAKGDSVNLLATVDEKSILRSLEKSEEISAVAIASACEDNSSNGLVLGSR